MSRIDPTTWKRLAPLLDQALDLEPDRRTAFVARELKGEPELQKILHELLEAESRTDGLPETPAPPWTEPIVPSIAGYEDLEEIGRGGMGIVYHATRCGDGFEQQVALKIVRVERGDPSVLERFDQERRILARLEHPNIARLVDGGTTADGRPYFAMEYVDGVPITTYADERRLGIRARLALFEEACGAVGFAQQQLVVHRDLKPSNILVDTDGRVRLLDFGIARIVQDDGAPLQDGLTRDGARLLTPEYAAPEQLRGEPPTTATDVYALGVVLFELLSGHHPHGSTREAALEFALGSRDSEWLPRAIGKERRVLQEGGQVEVRSARAVAEARGVTPRALRRALSGDLAVIADTALRRDPTTRYRSVEALLGDVVRQREGRPITARPPSWAYATRKALKRHRVAVTAGLIVIVAIGVGLGTALWQARLAAREADRAVRAYDFLAGLFRDTHPDASQGEDWSPAQLLERGAMRLETSWPDDPEARESLLHEIALILTDRGDFDPAARILRRRIEEDPERVPVDVVLALARLELTRDDEAAADSLVQWLDASGRPLDERQYATFLESAASIHSQQGSYAVAESLILEVMDFTRSEYGEDSVEYASDLSNLSIYQHGLSRPDEAEASLLQALDIAQRVQPGINTATALYLHNLGDLYMKEKRNAEAIDAYQRAIEMRRRLYPDGHYQLAGSLRGLAISMRQDNRLDTADSLLAASIAMSEAVGQTQGDEFARSMNELAVLAYLRQDYDAARERFVRALEIFERENGPAHPITMTVANNLATIQLMTDELEAAEATYRRILERRREVLGDRHGDVAFSYNSIGIVLRRMERYEESIASHREALERYLEIHGEEHDRVAGTRAYLGASLRDAERFDEALAAYESALSYRMGTLDAGNRDLEETRAGYGHTLIRAGRWEEGHRVLLEMEEASASSESVPTRWVHAAQAARGLALAKMGRVDEGRTLARAAVDALIAEKGEEHASVERARAYLRQIDGP